jgi:hypothetical protein
MSTVSVTAASYHAHSTITWAVDFNHRDEATELEYLGQSISQSQLKEVPDEFIMFHFGTDTVEAAIGIKLEKCDLLCRNCYVVITVRDFEDGAEDGDAAEEEAKTGIQWLRLVFMLLPWWPTRRPVRAFFADGPAIVTIAAAAGDDTLDGATAAAKEKG